MALLARLLAASPLSHQQGLVLTHTSWMPEREGGGVAASELLLGSDSREIWTRLSSPPVTFTDV